MPRRPEFSPYRKAQARARRRVNRLSEDTVRAVSRELRAFADDVRKGVMELPARATQVDIARRAAEDLEKRLTKTVGEARTAAFEDIREVWANAAEELAEAQGIPRAALGAVYNPPITIVGAYEALGHPSMTWKTLLPEYAKRAATDIDGIVSRALARDVSPNKLARRLAPYVRGSEDFSGAFSPLSVELKELRSTDPTLRNAGAKMMHNARRIAFSETHNARGEAETQHYAADPMVRAVAWRLSPDRGTLAGPDECDGMANSDFYGLGEGMYPVDNVPMTPHPWDRCERVPVTRDYREAFDERGKPRTKPTPGRMRSGRDANLGTRRVSRDRASRIRERVERHLSFSERAGPDVGPILQKLGQTP